MNNSVNLRYFLIDDKIKKKLKVAKKKEKKNKNFDFRLL
jgi:hypothetical protein